MAPATIAGFSNNAARCSSNTVLAKMILHSRALRAIGTLALLACCMLSDAIDVAQAATAQQVPAWGAVASTGGWYGYAVNQASREAAELAAKTQCDRAAGRTGTCVVRAYFDRACGAVATGNYGEWGAAAAATADAARKSAAEQCDSHLPTEPCKVLVNVCSTQ